ncbi:putative monooxygenase [Saccharothrix espanaensis DSM 44229]|uniref:Putative monooxygenase n=1 Tax=Saccharothrix espanaensis (strain ATCC 51144 / DSM 44229 / JCM 9112 / NBRC 15066 / NRRL 15764) TaxID=1179773 RepID=K0K1E0_SACES|nr:putative monooxygenase [Saccharothrix espanaensis DSM 44229]
MELLADRHVLGGPGRLPGGGPGHFGGLPLDLAEADPGHRFAGRWKCPQTVLERVLGRRAAALGARVRRGAGLAERGDHVEAEVVVAGERRRVAAAYLAGCDGQDSAVRVLGGFDFPGADAARELLRADVEGLAIPDRRFERHPHGLATAWRRPDGSTRVMVHVFGASPRPRTPDFAEIAAAWRHVTGEDIAHGRPTWLDAFDDEHRQAAGYRRGRGADPGRRPGPGTAPARRAGGRAAARRVHRPGAVRRRPRAPRPHDQRPRPATHPRRDPGRDRRGGGDRHGQARRQDRAGHRLQPGHRPGHRAAVGARGRAGRGPLRGRRGRGGRDRGADREGRRAGVRGARRTRPAGRRARAVPRSGAGVARAHRQHRAGRRGEQRGRADARRGRARGRDAGGVRPAVRGQRQGPVLPRPAGVAAAVRWRPDRHHLLGPDPGGQSRTGGVRDVQGRRRAAHPAPRPAPRAARHHGEHGRAGHHRQRQRGVRRPRGGGGDGPAVRVQPGRAGA